MYCPLYRGLPGRAGGSAAASHAEDNRHQGAKAARTTANVLTGSSLAASGRLPGDGVVNGKGHLDPGEASGQTVSQAAPSHLLPGDEGWMAEKVLVADLSTLNAQISRYVLRLLDADAGRAAHVSVEDEQALGLLLAELGKRVQGRAAQRAELVGGGELVIEGEKNPQPQALEPGQGQGQGLNSDMDNGP